MDAACTDSDADLLALSGYVVWQLPVAEIGRLTIASAETRQQLVTESRKTVAQILGGLILIVTGSVGAYFTLRQLAVTQSGQITESLRKSCRTPCVGRITN